jgi:hypothetical protein
VLAPGGHWVAGHASLWTAAAESLALCQQIRTKTDPIYIQETISVASRPLDILYMGLTSDDEERCWSLVAHGWRAMPVYGLQLLMKIWHFTSKSGPKLIPFAVMKPCQLPPDP